MPTLIFHCPECNQAISATVDHPEDSRESTRTIRLECLKVDGKGCGWIGYLPASWGNRF